MVNGEYQALKAALEWHLDAGADFPLTDTPAAMLNAKAELPSRRAENESVKSTVPVIPLSAAPLGANEARTESVALAQKAQTLEDLKQAIAAFDGLGLKETATNLVFADGNPEAAIMLIGDAPGGDDDRAGQPFAGVQGQLLDRILFQVGLSREEADPLKAIYISNILNWRPPGNRSPTPAEIEISLPFIERHIQLVKPKMLILLGGVAAQSLYGSGDSISKLRGRFQPWRPRTPELQAEAVPVPALATYHPEYLLNTPGQKKHVWADLLTILEKRRELGLIQ